MTFVQRTENEMYVSNHVNVTKHFLYIFFNFSIYFTSLKTKKKLLVIEAELQGVKYMARMEVQHRFPVQKYSLPLIFHLITFSLHCSSLELWVNKHMVTTISI